MITFAELKTQNHHFKLYIQWFKYIENSAIFKPLVKRNGVNKLHHSCGDIDRYIKIT